MSSSQYINVFALAYSSDHLYVGGTFTAAGSITAMRVADLNLNNTTWSALFNGPGGNGLDGNVKAIVISGTDVYVGGEFTRAGPIAANYIAKWNGSSWSALGAGVDFHVLALALQGNTLYVGGDFTGAGGRAQYNLARYNPTCDFWLPVGKQGVNDRVLALALTSDQLLAGGQFSLASEMSGNVPSARLATLPHQSITCQRVYLPSILK